MKKSVHYLSAMLMVAFFTQPAAGQFEGTITYQSYEYSDDGEREKQDEFTLYITPDRIMLQGNDKYSFMGSIETEGVLVRLDRQDFVFMTGDEEALSISKSDIISMMNMFGAGTQPTADDEEINYEQTGESKTILGYPSDKFVFKDDEDQNTVVWMTKGIDVNWGMLAEPWGNNADNLISGGFPMDVIFKGKYFPVKVQGYKNGKLVTVLEAIDINRSPVPEAMVEVPDDVKVLSFQEYLFREMSQ
jgi:GLPGLI family protein